MIALISDIHGNLEALTAVLEDVKRHDVDAVYFLGDVVGYGPDPEKCIDLVAEHCSVQLVGNHDFAMLTAPVGFNPIAAGAISCLRARMEPGVYSMPWKRRRWEFLGDLRLSRREGHDLFVHASPRDPIREYIVPSDPEYHPEKLADIFERIEHTCYVGHTHFPGVIVEGEEKFHRVEDMDYRYAKGEAKAVVNIGSVGQPRDRDPRSCYVLMSEREVIWRRVEYDIETTIAKIKANDCLDDRSGLRLAEGK
ncbi:MAG: metallophosphoesterase [Planctomycetes bacterium]|nr:metallophosphoesterase [Planctomycetota bacterium]